MTSGADKIAQTMEVAAEHHRAGRLRQAEGIYKRILEGRPDDADALHLLGVLCHQRGKNDVAVELIGKAIQSNPAKAVFFTNLAIVLHKQGRFEEAIASYRRALEIEPDSADAHSNLGVALQAQGQPDEAAASYRRAVAIDPDCGEARIGLSAILASRGRLKEARKELSRAIRRKPLYTTECANQGKCLASILRLVGLQNAYFVLTSDWHAIVKSGHFNTRLLVDNRKFMVHRFYILDRNLSSYTKDLPAFDVVLNSIADPDTEPESLQEARKFIVDKGVPFINDPQAVFSTSREANYRLLNDVGNLLVPKTVKTKVTGNDKSSVAAILDRHALRLPLIVRPVGRHTGKGMMKIDSMDDFASMEVPQRMSTFYVSEFHDYRSDDGYFRKMRFICVNGEIFPEKLSIATHWNNHLREFSHEFMKQNAWTMEEEKAFLENHSEYLGERNCGALREIYNRIGLDFFGVDCAVLPNGKLLVFEANPCMSVRHREAFPHRRKYTRKIMDAFGQMILAKIDTA